MGSSFYPAHSQDPGGTAPWHWLRTSEKTPPETRNTQNNLKYSGNSRQTKVRNPEKIREKEANRQEKNRVLFFGHVLFCRYTHLHKYGPGVYRAKGGKVVPCVPTLWGRNGCARVSALVTTTHNEFFLVLLISCSLIRTFITFKNGSSASRSRPSPLRP